MRTVALVGFLALLSVTLEARQDSDRLQIDEVSESFLRQWAAAEESNNTKELLDLYAVAYDTLRSKLAQPDPDVARWIPLGRVLTAKLAGLPPAALEAHEVIARQVLETVLEPTERRKAAEKYAYTKAGREALDRLTNQDYDDGRIPRAMKGWSRALELRPGTELVARLALAHSLRGDTVALSMLRTWADAHSLRGPVAVGGQKLELGPYLDSLKAPAPQKPPDFSPGPSTAIPLGHYDLENDGRYGEHMAVMLPAVGRSGKKEIVVVSNGRRVTAIDPARAEGGSIEEALEWRYPKDRPISWFLRGPSPYALPYVGATISDGRVFCPMFSEHQEPHQQVGRRNQRFLGASVLRALDLGTGESLWDTDTLEVEDKGIKVPLLEYLRLDKSDFCFGGPPVVSGDRVYAAVMTSPFTGRHCWALCLDARTGNPLWCTDIGTAPPTKEMSVAQLAVEEGTVIFSTNFGIVASLDAATGSFEWLIKYLGGRSGRTHRPAVSPPVIAGSLVYVLPQDCDGLLAFDRWTGLEAPIPNLPADTVWSGVIHLLGRAGDWLVFSGPQNLLFRPLDGQLLALPETENSRLGRGTISGNRLFLPTPRDVSIFDTGTWKKLETLPWSETKEAGNLLVAGPLLVHLSDRLDLYTSQELLEKRFAPVADPPSPQPVQCRQLARILEGAGKLKESVPYYRRALEIWEHDPAWQETVEGLKKKLADLAQKLGDDFPQK